MEPVFADRKSVLDYAERTFGTLPDYPWLKDPKSAVLRHQDTAKWYGLIMEIPPKRLGLSRRRGHPEYKMRPAGAGRSDRLSAVFSGISYE